MFFSFEIIDLRLGTEVRICRSKDKRERNKVLPQAKKVYASNECVLYAKSLSFRRNVIDIVTLI